MKFTRATGTLGLAALAVIGSPLALAAEPGWYVGANYGQSRANIDDEGITRALAGANLTTTSISDNRRDDGFKVLLGYQLNRNFALEGGYYDLGNFGFVATTQPTGSFSGKTKLKGFNFDGVGTLPLTDRLSAFARFGVAYTDVKDTFVGSGAVTVANSSANKKRSAVKFGVGLEYAVTPAVGVRLEAERYRIDDAVGARGDIDLVSLGVVYRFGATAAPPPRAAERVPEAVAVAPAPPPPVVVAPPPPVVVAPPPPPVVVAPPPPPPPPKPIPRKRIKLSGDTSFTTNSAVLTRSGNAALDTEVLSLIKEFSKVESITVEGHASPLGSDEDNMKLSQQRADAVKAYLISQGVNADLIKTVAKGESEPVADVDCSLRLPKAKLTKCYAPHRRVEVEVNGVAK